MYDKIDLYSYDRGLIDRVENAMTSNPAFVKVGNYSECKYLLMSRKAHANKHGLTVQITRKTRGDDVAPPLLHISGSIRKWHYGSLSMNDLTRYDTMIVLNRLADELVIPYSELNELPLSSVEVGLNLDIGGLRCEDIRSRLCSFRDSRYKPTEYKTFKTKKTSAKMYDKVQEMRATIYKTPDKIGVDRFENQYGKKRILRVEYKVYGGANLIDGFFGIRTVGDMVEQYNRVALKWLQYSLKFGFKGTDMLPLTLTKKSAKEVMDYLKCRGLLDIGEVELDSMLDRLPAQARKDVRSAIKTLRDKMPDAINVKQVFRQIATRHFVQQFNNSYRQYYDEIGMNNALR